VRRRRGIASSTPSATSAGKGDIETSGGGPGDRLVRIQLHPGDIPAESTVRRKLLHPIRHRNITHYITVDSLPAGDSSLVLLGVHRPHWGNAVPVGPYPHFKAAIFRGRKALIFADQSPAKFNRSAAEALIGGGAEKDNLFPRQVGGEGSA